MTSLTSKKIAALKPREKRFTISDGHGLTLRVMPSGVKSWVFRLSETGKVTDITLGRWPEMSLKAARQEARRRRKVAGLTPQRGYVLNDAFRLWKNLKRGRIVSFRDEKKRIEHYVMDKIGNRQLDEITAPLIIHTVMPIERSGKRSTLKRILMRTREILDLAVCAGFLPHNPIERVSKVFAPPRVKPMPAVHWKELPDVMRVMTEAPRDMQLLFAWSLLSMLRPGENAKLKWEWIDEDVLTLPASEMKKRRIHRVPLSELMLKLLSVIRKESPHPRSGFIFPAKRTGSKHVYQQNLTKHLFKTPLRGRLVGHGLRSVARGWMADNGMSFEASEACLSHVTGSSVSRAYQRSDFLESRRQIMAAWSSFVSDCARSARFLPGVLFAEPVGEKLSRN